MAAIAWHLSWLDWVIIVSYHMVFPEILNNLPESCVDTQFDPFVEVLVAQGTLTLLFASPVSGNTGLAKVVSTWSRNRLSENIQTDGAQELILRQERAGYRHICNNTMHRNRVHMTYTIRKQITKSERNIVNSEQSVFHLDVSP